MPLSYIGSEHQMVGKLLGENMLKTTQPVVSSNFALKRVNSAWAPLAGIDRDFKPAPQKSISLTQHGAISEADAETLHEFLKDIPSF
jgi:hypothetical protein